MKEKQAVTRKYQGLYHKAAKKAKSALPGDFTRLTGCHRKSAIRLFNARPVKPVMVYAGGKAVKLKPEKKKRPPNRKGKRVYTGEVIACLRLVRTLPHPFIPWVGGFAKQNPIALSKRGNSPPSYGWRLNGIYRSGRGPLLPIIIIL
jgi:hypothetical protein